MKTYTVYNAEKIVKVLKVSEETLALNISEDESYVEGEFSDEFYYIKDGEITEYPTKPDYPVSFDSASEQWIKNNELALDIFKQERNQLLADTDWTQVSDSPLSDSKKTEWQTYRQALRDMPSQEGFDPLNPVYPTKPS